MSVAGADTFQKMDMMYRYQRYFYDATRKYYLLGRDRLLDKMDVADGDNIAEIGCGTGRNLEILARRYPNASFFGLDASNEMLTTARSKIEASGTGNITYATALADRFDHYGTFGLASPFDALFFSYSITMIAGWQASIENAIDNLRPGGLLYIVDFYDQGALPVWFRRVLTSWLRRFHVQFWPGLMPYLFELDRSARGTLEIETVARRYAFIATFRKNT